MADPAEPPVSSMPPPPEPPPTPAARRCPRCGADLSAAASPGGLCPKCLLELGLGGGKGAPELIVTGAGEAPAPTPAIEDLAPKFPQYELLGLLGRGGMGAVYKARQKGLDRMVALKILPAETGRDPTWPERFLREARALARLTHPNIVAVHDFGDVAGLYFFAMEFVDGSNLRQVMLAKSATPAEALKIVMQVCDALQYAHEEGVVHRDIKPENILVDRRGRVKIADFGLAKLVRGDGGGVTLTATHQTMGTPHYMAPEQWEKPQAVDHRADIYSLGVVFYELLTGELPIGRFAPPSHKVLVDVRVDEVVLKTLEKEPALRYQQASQMKTAVGIVSQRVEKAAAEPQVKKGRIRRALSRIRRVLDPTHDGTRSLWGIPYPSKWGPLGLVGFFVLCIVVAVSAAGFLAFVLGAMAVYGIWAVLRKTKAS